MSEYAFPGETVEWTKAYLAALAGNSALPQDGLTTREIVGYAEQAANETVALLAERTKARVEETKRLRDEAVAKVNGQKKYRDALTGVIMVVEEIDGADRVRLVTANGGHVTVSLHALADGDEECTNIKPYNV